MNQKHIFEEQELQGLFQAAEWMQRLMNGVITHPETAALNQWITESQQHETWFTTLAEESGTTDHLRIFQGVEAGARSAFIDTCARAGIRNAVQKQGSRRRQLLAVAILLPLLLGALWYLGRGSRPLKRAKAATVTDIGPGGNRAMLRLSDGRSVILDSASIGLLATEGNAKVSKTTNGELSYSIQGRSEQGAVQYNTIVTPVGGIFSVALSDGTRVWLNSGSSLRYPVSFGRNGREVYLSGEGYFEVSPSTSSFAVVVNDSVRVSVLGTDFNISSYGDEPSLKTTLIRGSLSVSRGEEKRLLGPGEQAVLTAAPGIRVDKNVDAEEVVAWKEGLFRFGHADLSTILRQVSRWYGVSVVYETAVPSTFLRGEAPRNVNLSKLLEGLSTMNMGVHCTLKGKELIVSK